MTPSWGVALFAMSLTSPSTMELPDAERARAEILDAAGLLIGHVGRAGRGGVDIGADHYTRLVDAMDCLLLAKFAVLDCERRAAIIEEVVTDFLTPLYTRHIRDHSVLTPPLLVDRLYTVALDHYSPPLAGPLTGRPKWLSGRRDNAELRRVFNSDVTEQAYNRAVAVLISKRLPVHVKVVQRYVNLSVQHGSSQMRATVEQTQQYFPGLRPDQVFAKVEKIILEFALILAQCMAAGAA